VRLDINSQICRLARCWNYPQLLRSTLTDCFEIHGDMQSYRGFQRCLVHVPCISLMCRDWTSDSTSPILRHLVVHSLDLSVPQKLHGLINSTHTHPIGEKYYLNCTRRHCNDCTSTIVSTGKFHSRRSFAGTACIATAYGASSLSRHTPRMLSLRFWVGSGVIAI
jgi:hypothetical protein